MNRSWLHPLQVSLAGATLIMGLLWLTPAKLMEGYDLARMHQCYKSDLRTALLAGEMPWWNPYTALGRPFLADVETACLYPPSWLVIPFGVDTGIWLMIGLHLALAIEGTRRLAAQLEIAPGFALAAGISFALSGALLGRIQSGQLQVFCVVCLWPWIWWAAVRLQDEPCPRSVVRTAVWLALSFLAGSPQILWCGLVTLGALLLARSPSWRATVSLGGGLTAAGLLAAGLTAVQLLPFVELVQQGNRPLQDAAFATRAGEPGLGWLTLLLPPGSWTIPSGEYNLHGGALFLIFACAALATAFRQGNVRALAAAGLLGVILALGDRTPVLPFLAEWVPGFGGVRYPSRYALGGVLTMTLLAAWWLDRARQEKRLGRPVVNLCLGGQGLTLIAGLFVQSEFYRVPATPANETQLRSDLREERLPQDGAPPRVALPASLLRANAGAQCTVSTLTGFNNPALARTWTSLYLMAGQPLPDYHRAEVRDEVILSAGRHRRYFGLSVVFSPDDGMVHFATPPAPRTFIGFAAVRVSNWQEAVRRVRAGHDFVDRPLVEQYFSALDDKPGSESHAAITAFGRNHVTVDYRSSAPGLLVLAEAWYPGWTARLDRTTELPVIPVNGWMRGVAVPAGANRLVFDYRPTWWWLGLGTTLLSGVLALAVWRSPFGRNRR